MQPQLNSAATPASSTDSASPQLQLQPLQHYSTTASAPNSSYTPSPSPSLASVSPATLPLLQTQHSSPTPTLAHSRSTPPELLGDVDDDDSPELLPPRLPLEVLDTGPLSFRLTAFPPSTSLKGRTGTGTGIVIVLAPGPGKGGLPPPKDLLGTAPYPEPGMGVDCELSFNAEEEDAMDEAVEDAMDEVDSPVVLFRSLSEDLRGVIVGILGTDGTPLPL